jgi:DNA processing protein
VTRRRLSGILPNLIPLPSPSALSIRTRDENLAWLRLTLVPGVSPAQQQALMRELGMPEQVLASPPSRIAEVAGKDAAARLAAGPDAGLLERSLAWLEETGHRLVALGDDAYPRALLQIPDPPTALYAVGNVALLDQPSVAIVGSRNATAQGARDAEAFAQQLSNAGLAIVSGLALGIDAAAHRGGLSGPGSTIAVIGTGADRVYPAANRALAHAIAEHGCMASEFPLGTPPAALNFPQRNRLISGLARGVIVVEAAERSGSLITARTAGEQGRDVFAIPGSIHSALSKGCHRLIKQGAKLVESAEDVLAELGVPAQAPGPRAASSPAAAEAPEPPLLAAMGHGPVTVDEIALATGEPVSAIASQLSQLQIEGSVATIAGGRFQRIARR